MSNSAPTVWIAADFSNGPQRFWTMQGATLLHEHRPEDFAKPPIFACGGPAGGICRSVPCAPLGGPFLASAADGLTCHMIPGLSQASPPDLMRGDETRVAGYLALNPGWDGVICLIGQHSRWIQVSAGEVVSFQTYLTGEILSALAGQTSLRAFLQYQSWNDSAFDEALSDALSRPERLAAQLHSVQAAEELQGTDAGISKARIHGALIGAELAAARPYWLGQNLVVIGTPPAAQQYVRALALQGVGATIVDPDTATLAGLTKGWQLFRDTQ